MAKKKQTEMEVRWKSGARFSEAKVSAERAYKEICRIKDQNGGTITAETIVDYAGAHQRSAMHKLIGMDEGWDDAKSAHRYRVMRAGNILRAIEVKYTKAQKEPVRAFNVDQSNWKKEDGYKPYRSTADILQDDDARASLLQSALNELVAFRRRYRALNELSIIIREIDSFMDEYHSTTAAST